jgi:hypothetical protein
VLVLSSCAAVLADGALAAAAGLPPGAAGLALLVGGLLALAGDADAGRRAGAQHVLALGLGALASAGLAMVLAGLVAPLTARL